MKKVIRGVKEYLESLSDADLLRLLFLHDRWFLTLTPFEVDDDIIAERAAVRKRKEIVTWVLCTDPIAVDGGLLDFIEWHKNGCKFNDFESGDARR